MFGKLETKKFHIFVISEKRVKIKYISGSGKIIFKKCRNMKRTSNVKFIRFLVTKRIGIHLLFKNPIVSIKSCFNRVFLIITNQLF